MSRLTTAAAIVTLCVGATVAFAQASPFGTWTRPSTGAKVNFYDCSGKLCAKVVSSKNKADEGKVIMTGAAKTSDTTWKGDLLNLEDGKTYSGVVTMESANGLNLKGCALGGLVCKGETWTK
jgi:uncharacterized protein (DUF2147 family)